MRPTLTVLALVLCALGCGKKEANVNSPVREVTWRSGQPSYRAEVKAGETVKIRFVDPEQPMNETSAEQAPAAEPKKPGTLKEKFESMNPEKSFSRWGEPNEQRRWLGKLIEVQLKVKVIRPGTANGPANDANSPRVFLHHNSSELVCYFDPAFRNELSRIDLRLDHDALVKVRGRLSDNDPFGSPVMGFLLLDCGLEVPPGKPRMTLKEKYDSLKPEKLFPGYDLSLYQGKHAGKFVELQMQVNQVIHGSKRDFWKVQFAPPKGTTGGVIDCYFAPEFREEISNIKPGQMVKVRGKSAEPKGYGSNSIMDCGLVQVAR